MSVDFSYLSFRPVTFQEYVDHFNLIERYPLNEAEELYNRWLADYYFDVRSYFRAFDIRYHEYIGKLFFKEHNIPRDTYVSDWSIYGWEDFSYKYDLEECSSICMSNIEGAQSNLNWLDQKRFSSSSKWGVSMGTILSYMERMAQIGRVSEIEESELWFNTMVHNPPSLQRELRSMKYGEYLKTTHWKRVRAAMLLINSARCQEAKCWSSGDRWYGGDWEADLHIHHLSYQNRGNERYRDLTLLCSKHHEQWHAHEKDSTIPPVNLWYEQS